VIYPVALFVPENESAEEYDSQATVELASIREAIDTSGIIAVI